MPNKPLRKLMEALTVSIPETTFVLQPSDKDGEWELRIQKENLEIVAYWPRYLNRVAFFWSGRELASGYELHTNLMVGYVRGVLDPREPTQILNELEAALRLAHQFCAGENRPAAEHILSDFGSIPVLMAEFRARTNMLKSESRQAVT